MCLWAKKTIIYQFYFQKFIVDHGFQENLKVLYILLVIRLTQDVIGKAAIH